MSALSKEVCSENVQTITSDIKQGYGVEDIRVRHGICETLSRKVVGLMREAGDLSKPGAFMPLQSTWVSVGEAAAPLIQQIKERQRDAD